MANGATRTTTSSRLTRARIIGTLATLVFLLVLWRAGARWAALPLLFLLIAYHFVLPRLVASRVEKFNRDAIKLLTTGRADKIPQLAGRSVFLQLFAPSPAISAKVALAHVELGDHRSACAAFENALQAPDPSEKLPLELGYAKALFVCGDISKSSQIAKRLLNSQVRLPELFVFVARRRMEDGDCGKETRSLLTQALEVSGSPESSAMARLAQGELALRSKKKTQLNLDNLPASSPFILGWREALRGMEKSTGGLPESAKKHYEAALTHIDYGFVSEIAKKGLAELGRSPAPISSAETMDPALRRKRRKRR